MATRTHRVAWQTARWCRFAAVTVDVVASARHEVEVAGNASGNPAHRREARLGAEQALRALAEGSGVHRVVVTNILATEVDTGVGDIHEAAAHAVWQALDAAPQPPYVGFSEPDLVAAWLRDRIGQRVEMVTEARHWHRGQRGADADSLIHAWLHFEQRPPVLLHGRGDELLLSIAEPYASYDMADYGEIRVGPARSPDLLASIVGVRLTDAAVIVGPSGSATCSGLALRWGGSETLIGTFCDEFVLAAEGVPTVLRPYWTIQPVVDRG